MYLYINMYTRDIICVYKSVRVSIRRGGLFYGDTGHKALPVTICFNITVQIATSTFEISPPEPYLCMIIPTF